jgi:hypothetical protein
LSTPNNDEGNQILELSLCINWAAENLQMNARELHNPSPETDLKQFIF